MHATGDVTNVTIYNLTAREQIFIDTSKIAGGCIKDGDTITLQTQKGNKGVTLLRDGATTNILNCLGKGPAWFTLSKGDNIFAYTADTGATNLQFYIEHKIAFDGV
jgi:hypothetical protein